MSKKLPPQEIVHLCGKELFVPSYYRELFPIDRDRDALRASIMRLDFLIEHAIVVRPRAGNRKEFEIVAGVGRWEVGLDLKRETIPAIVKILDDREARAHTAYDNLQASNTSSRICIVQAIVLALDYAEQSGTRYNPKLARLAAGRGPATHRRAMESLNYALDELRQGICKDVATASVARIVAEAVKYAKSPGGKTSDRTEIETVEADTKDASLGGRSRWYDFEEFYTGELPVNTFKKLYYSPSEQAAEQRKRQQQAITTLAAIHAAKKKKTLQPEVPVADELTKPAAQPANPTSELNDDDALKLVASLAAKLSSRLGSDNGLPVEFVELLRGVDLDTAGAHRFCKALTTHLKPPANKSPVKASAKQSPAERPKPAAPPAATPSLFDSPLFASPIEGGNG